MREIVCDTETTGLEPDQHRIVEIGCVELIERQISGKHWHCYFNPERAMPKDAEKIHGLTTEFLSDKPLFADKAQEFLAFIGDAPLIAHNAHFDFGFINAELERAGYAQLAAERIIDTMDMARERFPGGVHTLDQLCRNFGINTDKREQHGALIDAELLARVYIELAIGERQTAFDLAQDKLATTQQNKLVVRRPNLLPSPVTDEDRAAHMALIDTINDAIWLDYLPSRLEKAA